MQNIGFSDSGNVIKAPQPSSALAPLYGIVSYFHLWGLRDSLGGLSTKKLSHGDRTG